MLFQKSQQHKNAMDLDKMDLTAEPAQDEVPKVPMKEQAVSACLTVSSS